MKLSLITVNFNQAEVTLELVQSLKKQDYKDYELIIVDNGSKEDITSLLMLEDPHIKVVRSAVNLGFAGGNNLGFAYASGEYLLYINNDTEVPSGTLKSMVSKMDQNENLGALNPLLYFYDHPEVLQFGGYTRINLLTARNKSIGYREKIKTSEQLLKVPYGHGAALMVRRAAIDKAGLMPENYFLYYEELDWSEKIRKAGFDIAVDYSVGIYHKESISTGQGSPLKTYFQTRNRILFIRRNVNSIPKRTVFYIFMLISFIKNCVKYLLKREIAHFKNFVMAFYWNLTNSINSEYLGYGYDARLKK